MLVASDFDRTYGVGEILLENKKGYKLECLIPTNLEQQWVNLVSM